MKSIVLEYLKSIWQIFVVAQAFDLTSANFLGNWPITNCSFGLIRGKWSRSAGSLLIANYLGIPYAEPPIGNLRFESPQPWNETWSGIRDSIKDGPPCVQRTSEGTIFGEEDCLHLNIFVPIPTAMTEVGQNSITMLIHVDGNTSFIELQGLSSNNLIYIPRSNICHMSSDNSSNL